MTIPLSRYAIGALLTAWWAVFVVGALTAWNPFGVITVLGFGFVCFVPGYLTLIALATTDRIDRTGRVILAVGLSILALMLVGLAGNTLLPLFGITTPLNTEYVVWLFTTLVFALFVFTFPSLTTIRLTIPSRAALRRATVLLAPGSFVLFAVVGALRLNNGESAWVTMVLLVAMSAWVLWFARTADRIRPGYVTVILYGMSLALLLMTSLRGWFIAGHDIQREFYVFTLARSLGAWSPDAYIDAYNTCLSITILPTLFANMLHVPDAYVFKVLFQVLFATTPVIVFLLARNWFSVRYAVLASVLFMAFPTFMQDMPYMGRQEIAFLFFGLMLYTLFEVRMTIAVRRTLFVLFGIGVVLSHYSTTYMVLFIFLSAASLSAVLRILLARTHWFASLRHTSGLQVTSGDVAERRESLISLPVVAILIAAAVSWSLLVTGSGGHVRTVAGEVWQTVANGFQDSSRSVDVLMFFSFDRQYPDRTIEEYITGKVDPTRAEHPERFYYATSTYADFPLTTLTAEQLPRTWFGSLSAGPLSVASVVTFMGQLLMKLLQVALLVGVAYAVFRVATVHRIDLDFFVLGVSVLIFIALCMALPLLSIEYGVLRAMQQAFFVLAPFLVLGMVVVARGFERLFAYWCRFVTPGACPQGVPACAVDTVPVVLTAVFLLYATGGMTQLVGANIPTVHLNNTGDDYMHYITLDTEHAAIAWLEARRTSEMGREGFAREIQADRFAQKKLQSVFQSNVSGDIYPGSLVHGSFVFVSPAVLKNHVARVLYEGVAIKYAYDVAFLEENKDVIYANGDVRVYR